MRKRIPKADVSAARLHVGSGVVPAGKDSVIAGGMIRRCAETPCSARDGDGGSARIVTCRDVARQRGQVAAYVRRQGLSLQEGLVYCYARPKSQAE